MAPSGHQRTAKQVGAFAQLRALARPLRLRVVADEEGFPVIPGRRGQVEWFHEEGVELAAFTAGRYTRPKLLAVPEVVKLQVGDTELRVRFPVGRLAEVAGVLRARRRRTGSPLTPERLASLSAGRQEALDRRTRGAVAPKERTEPAGAGEGACG